MLSSSTKSTFETPKKTFSKASPTTDPKPKAATAAVQTPKVAAPAKETAIKSSKDEPKKSAETKETATKTGIATGGSGLKSEKKSPKTTTATTGTKSKTTTATTATTTKKDNSLSIARKLLGVTIDNPTPVTAPKGQASSSSATNDKPKIATSKATTTPKTKAK